MRSARLTPPTSSYKTELGWGKAQLYDLWVAAKKRVYPSREWQKRQGDNLLFYLLI